jgi:hypothetical protein
MVKTVAGALVYRWHIIFMAVGLSIMPQAHMCILRVDASNLCSLGRQNDFCVRLSDSFSLYVCVCVCITDKNFFSMWLGL